MILVTVGTQLPFDRLIRIMDRIAPDLDGEVFAQTGAGNYRPVHMQWRERIDAAEFDRKFQSADVIVGHAGVGTVLMAQRNRKPFILFPRRASLHEHRNDHQTATAKVLEGRPGIYIAESEEQLRDLLSRPLAPPPEQTEMEQRQMLIDRLTGFIEGR